MATVKLRSCVEAILTKCPDLKNIMDISMKVSMFLIRLRYFGLCLEPSGKPQTPAMTLKVKRKHFSLIMIWSFQ